MSGQQSPAGRGLMATPERACTKCRHIKYPPGMGEPTCLLFEELRGYDPVTATPSYMRIRCIDLRRVHADCDTDGNLWEPAK